MKVGLKHGTVINNKDIWNYTTDDIEINSANLNLNFSGHTATFNKKDTDRESSVSVIGKKSSDKMANSELTFFGDRTKKDSDEKKDSSEKGYSNYLDPQDSSGIIKDVHVKEKDNFGNS